MCITAIITILSASVLLLVLAISAYRAGYTDAKLEELKCPNGCVRPNSCSECRNEDEQWEYQREKEFELRMESV